MWRLTSGEKKRDVSSLFALGNSHCYLASVVCKVRESCKELIVLFTAEDGRWPQGQCGHHPHQLPLSVFATLCQALEELCLWVLPCLHFPSCIWTVETGMHDGFWTIPLCKIPGNLPPLKMKGLCKPLQVSVNSYPPLTTFGRKCQPHEPGLWVPPELTAYFCTFTNVFSFTDCVVRSLL